MTHSIVLVVIGFLLVGNPLHRRPLLPLGAPQAEETKAVAAIAAAIASTVLMALAIIGPWLLDVADISVPNARVAAGITLVVAALAQLLSTVRPRTFSTAGEAIDGPAGKAADGANGTNLRRAVVPGAFPALLRPELGVLAVVTGADLGWWAAAIGTLIVMALTVAWSIVRGSTPVTGLERAVTAALAVALVFLAIDQIIDGVLAI